MENNTSHASQVLGNAHCVYPPPDQNSAFAECHVFGVAPLIEGSSPLGIHSSNPTRPTFMLVDSFEKFDGKQPHLLLSSNNTDKDVMVTEHAVFTTNSQCLPGTPLRPMEWNGCHFDYPPLPTYLPKFHTPPGSSLSPPMILSEPPVKIETYILSLHKRSIPQFRDMDPREFEPYFSPFVFKNLTPIQAEIMEVVPNSTRHPSTTHNLAGYLRHRGEGIDNEDHHRTVFNFTALELWKRGFLKKSVDGRWFRTVADGNDVPLPYRLDVPTRKLILRDRRARGGSLRKRNLSDTFDLSMQEAFSFLPRKIFNPMELDFTVFLSEQKSYVLPRTFPMNKAIGALSLRLFPQFDTPDTAAELRLINNHALLPQFLTTYYPELPLDTFQMLDVYVYRRSCGRRHFESLAVVWSDLTFHERVVLFFPAPMFLKPRVDYSLNAENFLLFAWSLFPCELMLNSYKSIAQHKPSNFTIIPSHLIRWRGVGACCDVPFCYGPVTKTAVRVNEMTGTCSFNLCTFHFVELEMSTDMHTIAFDGETLTFEQFRAFYRFQTVRTFQHIQVSTFSHVLSID